jgi:hypothetical protein
MSKINYPAGTIIKGKMKHRAAVLDYFGGDPVAVMITSSSETKYPDNFLMQANHFETGHPFGWRGEDKPSYMVCRRFIKIREWGEFRKVGMLTGEGLVFVKQRTENQHPIYWRDYILDPRI